MDEKHLIAGLTNKNKIVFDFIFSYYYSGLCAYARRWVDSPEVAEDLVQDFFVRLWINSSNIEITSSLKSYLFSSIKNKALDHLKHVKVEVNYEKKLKHFSTKKDESSNWEFTESELTELIDKALQKLPPRCREIFTMSRFEGKNNADIATILGISKRTVELQISNALKTLRIELKDYLPTVLLFWLLK